MATTSGSGGGGGGVGGGGGGGGGGGVPDSSVSRSSMLSRKKAELAADEEAVRLMIKRREEHERGGGGGGIAGSMPAVFNEVMRPAAPMRKEHKDAPQWKCESPSTVFRSETYDRTKAAMNTARGLAISNQSLSGDSKQDMAVLFELQQLANHVLDDDAGHGAWAAFIEKHRDQKNILANFYIGRYLFDLEESAAAFQWLSLASHSLYDDELRCACTKMLNLLGASVSLSRPSKRPIPASEPGPDEPTYRCMLCTERRVNVIIKPCNHIALCEECAMTLPHDSNVSKICLICRHPITNFERCFHS